MELQRAASSSDEVEDEDDQRHNEQEVNKPAGYVEAEPKDPKKQDYDKDCPEHGNS